MGKRTYATENNQHLNNLHKMIKSYGIPHEGNPDVGFEMLEMLLENNEITEEVYQRMLKMMNDSMLSHEKSQLNNDFFDHTE